MAAVASFLDARSHQGQWIVRVEDIDPPREVPGSAGRILADLERFGMTSDEDILYQSTRTAAYENAVRRLIDRGKAYWCGCSRSDLPESGVYPGTCREGIPSDREPRSVRLGTAGARVSFHDRIQGSIAEDVGDRSGDFIIRRADGLPAYQLAVVLDDAEQGITHIVRGADLLDSTPRQVCVQQALGLDTPEYAHVPIAVDGTGCKLSKRLDSDPISGLEPAFALRTALQFLGQDPPAVSNLEQLWSWAIEHWDMNRISST